MSKKTRTNGLAETYKKFFECSQTKEISGGCSKPDHDIVSSTPYQANIDTNIKYNGG